jgi:hypothetical protein
MSLLEFGQGFRRSRAAFDGQCQTNYRATSRHYYAGTVPDSMKFEATALLRIPPLGHCLLGACNHGAERVARRIRGLHLAIFSDGLAG